MHTIKMMVGSFGVKRTGVPKLRVIAILDIGFHFRLKFLFQSRSIPIVIPRLGNSYQEILLQM